MIRYNYLKIPLLLAGLAASGDGLQAQNLPVAPVLPSATPRTLPKDFNDAGPVNSLNYIRTWQPMVAIKDANDLYLSTLQSRSQQVARYFDGLGRPIETVIRSGSGKGSRDLVTLNTYDAVGRETFKYLPYAAAPIGSESGKFRANGFSAQDNFYQNENFNVGTFSNESIRYDETRFDQSPLNRPVKNLPPGNSWGGSGNGTTVAYLSEGPAVRLWTISGNMPVTTSVYATSQLGAAQTTDAQGGEVTEYKDMKGRLILKKVKSATNTWLSTYYVYDDMNRLRFVIPPLATEKAAGNNWSLTTTLLNDLCFQYDYDGRGRNTRKLIPGKGNEYMVYDRKDRLVLSQDSNLRSVNQWMFTLYDVLNRPVMSGTYSRPSVNRQSLQDHIDGVAGISTDGMLTTLINANIYKTYPNSSALTGADVLSYTYYDDYSNPDIAAYQFDVAYVSMLPTASSASAMPVELGNMTKNLITGTRVRVMKPSSGSWSLALSEWNTTVNFYDNNRRVIQTQSTNHRSGLDINTIQYNFQGNKLGEVLHTENPTVTDARHQVTTIRKRYQYDNAGRLANTYHRINNGPERNLYTTIYDALGRAEAKNPISSTDVASQDYDYNIRGWLSGINRSWVEGQGNDRFFGEVLSYNNGFSQPSLTGNISGIRWRNSGSAAPQQAYGYAYDLAGRLTRADYNEYINSAWKSTSHDYSMSYATYDANGNIQSMKQRGPGPNGPIDMDVLSYSYKNNASNELRNVYEGGVDYAANPDFKDCVSGCTSTDYAYDGNGNLTKDENKEINAITYSYLNRPENIGLSGSRNIRYVYDASGNKLMKVVTENGNDSFEEYIGDNVYTQKDYSQPVMLAYVLHEEGKLMPKALDPDPLVPEAFDYHFFSKDHLGNVRSVVKAEETAYPQQYVASLELGSANIERIIFQNTDPVRMPKPNTVEPGDLSAAELVGGDPNRRVGPSLFLRAMAGAKFNVSVDAYFEDNGAQASIGAQDMLGSLLGAFALGQGSLPGGSEGGSNFTLVDQALSPNNYLNAFESIRNDNTDLGKPQAYLNYMVFDEGMNLIPEQSGAIQVSQSGTWHTLGTAQEIKIDRNGYLLFSLTSASLTGPVWFDHLNITYFEGRLQEENHYYPFGLTLQTQAVGNTLANNYLYNGKQLQQKEFSNGAGLNWYDFGSRMLDQQISRWNGIDAQAEKMYSSSPYSYAINNPVSFIDPDGEFPLTFHIRSFAPFLFFAAQNWAGDNRGFTTDKNVTSRLAQKTTYETTTKKYKSEGIGSVSTGIYFGNPVVARSEARIQGGDDGMGNGVGDNISTHLSGNDDAVIPGADGTAFENLQSPDIDVESNFSITQSGEDKEGNSTISISGKMFGDAFPAAEAFVEDSKGNRVFMGVSPAKFGPNEGPFVALFGQSKFPMANLNVSIAVNKDGVFQGVKTVNWQNGKPVSTQMSIVQWNEQFTKKKTH